MNFDEIPGLSYTANAIDEKQETRLIAWINSNTWLPVKSGDTKANEKASREVQQFGAHYDYGTRALGETTPIPKILINLAKQLGLPKPENIIINKYEPGEGIASHTDNRIFGDTVASLSLLSMVPMDLQQGNTLHTIQLEPRSLIKLTGQARLHWTHGITSRKSDIYMGKKIMRSKRISITFRTLESSDREKAKTKAKKISEDESDCSDKSKDDKSTHDTDVINEWDLV